MKVVLDTNVLISGGLLRGGAQDAYSDPDHCHYRYEAALGWLPPVDGVEDVRDYVAGLDSHRSPGEAHEYVSVNTFVLGWLAEAVTSRREKLEMSP